MPWHPAPKGYHHTSPYRSLPAALITPATEAAAPPMQRRAIWLALQNAIATHLAAGRSVTVKNLGTFRPYRRADFHFIDPNKNIPKTTPGYPDVHFTPSDYLREVTAGTRQP